MPNRPVHVAPRGENWAVEREGADRASSLHDTQAAAEKAGRATARDEKTEFLLHGRDGAIRERARQLWKRPASAQGLNRYPLVR
jgi:Uncharacterized protein conserved in bacteria (DUF2188)